MTKIERLLLGFFGLLSGIATAQPLDPAVLTKPLGDSWPTYSGDYSGKRYSALTQVNQSNVRNLTLAWVSRVTAGAPATGGGRGGFGGGAGGGGAPAVDLGQGAGVAVLAGLAVECPPSLGVRAPATRTQAAEAASAAAPASARQFWKSTPSFIFLRRITLGRRMLETVTFYGITFGKPRVALTSEIAAWACGATGSTWRRPTITWCVSMRGRVRSAGTRKSPTSTSSI